MAVRQRTVPGWLRAAGLVLGVGFILWLPVEDTDPRPATVTALLTVAWLAAAQIHRLPVEAGQNGIRRFLLAGALAGLAISPLAAFFMVFKSGLHGHGFPDYSADQLVSVLRRTPVWTLFGLITGLGGGLWLQGRDT